MDQPAQINSQPISPPAAVSPQPPVFPRKSNKIPLILGLIILVILVGLGGIWLGRYVMNPQVIPEPTSIPLPTIEISPTLIPTVPPDLTVSWKTYTNNFANFSLKYPDTLTYTEKSFSDKEKQVVFKGVEGSLTINMATSDYSPGWGGGCDEKDKKKITFIGNQVEVCLNDNGMHELYTSHPSGNWNLNISATFLGSSPAKSQELFNQILSTFKFLPSQLTPTPDPTVGWKTYTNTQYKYSVKYPADYSVIETSFDYVRFSPGINNPNLPQGQTYLSVQLDKSPQQLPEAVYKKTADGKTLRISQILMDVDENQKPQIKAIFDQIIATFKFLL